MYVRKYIGHFYRHSQIIYFSVFEKHVLILVLTVGRVSFTGSFTSHGPLDELLCPLPANTITSSFNFGPFFLSFCIFGMKDVKSLDKNEGICLWQTEMFTFWVVN